MRNTPSSPNNRNNTNSRQPLSPLAFFTQLFLFNLARLAQTHRTTHSDRRLITAPPNTERRLIVLSTEGRVVLHQGDTNRHLLSAFFSLMHLISIINATGIGRGARTRSAFDTLDFNAGLSSLLSLHILYDLSQATSYSLMLEISRLIIDALIIDDFEMHRGRAFSDIRSEIFPDFHPRPPHDDRPSFGALTTAGAFAFIERPIAVPLPQNGKNSKTLSEIEGFDINDVPEEFCCQLSGDIMDDPVIDPTTLNDTALLWLDTPESQKSALDRGNYDEAHRFERSWLERAINDKGGKSPMTRQDVEIALISDSKRKDEIDNFVLLQTSGLANLSF